MEDCNGNENIVCERVSEFVPAQKDGKIRKRVYQQTSD